jgi:hypothetical protein
VFSKLVAKFEEQQKENLNQVMDIDENSNAFCKYIFEFNINTHSLMFLLKLPFSMMKIQLWMVKTLL